MISRQSIDLNKKLLFSYGSNGIQQLRTRVVNPYLQSKPAIAVDFIRTFCLRSFSWGGRAQQVSGVANIMPLLGSKTFGSVVELTNEEFHRLHSYEGGYEYIEISIIILTEDNKKIKTKAFAYIAKNPVFKTRPTEQYLTAIHVHLRDHWDMKNQAITIRGLNQDTLQIDIFKDWVHPGIKNLSLESIVVEINSHKKTPWEMPKTIKKIVNKLTDIGINSTEELGESLSYSSNGTLMLNDALSDRGYKIFGKDTILILKTLLGSSLL